MIQRLKEWYHRYVLMQVRCPKCGAWANYMGDIPVTGEEEFLCSKCNTYIRL